MDSDVRDDSVPMDDAATEESTSSASERSKSSANPEASKPTQPPVEKQASGEDGFVFPKRKRRKDKLPAEKSADVALPETSTDGCHEAVSKLKTTSLQMTHWGPS